MIALELTKEGIITKNSNSGERCWFAMFTPPRKVANVKQFLDKNSIESIIPMQYKEVTQRGKTTKELAISYLCKMQHCPR